MKSSFSPGDLLRAEVIRARCEQGECDISIEILGRGELTGNLQPMSAKTSPEMQVLYWRLRAGMRTPSSTSDRGWPCHFDQGAQDRNTYEDFEKLINRNVYILLTL